MKIHIVENERTARPIAERVGWAGHPVSRMIGLLGRATLGPGEGLWISGCSAIHTLGMRATIDCYFLDRHDRVLRIAAAVAPGRLAVTCRGAKSVLELGAAPGERGIRVGDRLQLR